MYCQILVVCAAFLAVGCIIGWGMTVPLMRCPYCQCTDVHFCQHWRSYRLSQTPGIGSVVSGTQGSQATTLSAEPTLGYNIGKVLEKTYGHIHDGQGND